MARELTLRTWDSEPQNTQYFKLTTKLTDFASPDGYKSLLGFYINTNRKILSTDLFANVRYSFIISYRRSTGNSWKTLAQIDSFGNQNFGSKFHKFMFPTPITRIRQIQLKIQAPVLKGDASINDFGLIYRKYRDSSVSSLDG
tara:strand:+ start:33 stop:461 length:429 start_codon:yes stop_codon:yes gene_type:complete